tara:strand:+ start:193 stop:495 length:303 start_codon:yes stop_codon:yes gene_type:complete
MPGWNGINTVGSPRMATANSLYGEPQASVGTVAHNSLNTVCGTGRKIAAVVSEKWRKKKSVQLDKSLQYEAYAGRYKFIWSVKYFSQVCLHLVLIAIQLL